MQTIKLPMAYYYKGSSNISLTLEIDKETELITIKTDYNETVATVTSAHGLKRVLIDLDDNKYA